jgi:glycosyltransferase involved in cell wall biosynthesis
MNEGRVVLDLVAPQSPSYRERGIARHGLDFANALVDRHADLIDRILLHPELPPVGGLEHLIESGKARTDLDGIGPGGIFHVTSAFEPELPIRSLWPRAVSAQRMRLVVTVYDLIPDIFPDMYLVDPGLRRRWRACRELARVADHVFTLSESGADDVVRLLGVPESRVSVIGAGCDARFRRPGSTADALKTAQAGVEGLGDHFVVYNGAIDPRKNLDRLVQAFAKLPAGVRSRWQLVLVCRADPLQRNHYLVMAEALGVSGQLLLPGYVSDATLVALYQTADLSVFPSLYEGYGLPVVEAQACGAPVIAADNSSLREMVSPEARFDAMDVEAISSAMNRALTNDQLRADLLAEAHRPPPTWAEVADRSAEVYQDLLDRDRGCHLTPGWHHELTVAIVSPLPGAKPTGDPYVDAAAAYAESLAAAFETAVARVDRFADGEDRYSADGEDRYSADGEDRYSADGDAAGPSTRPPHRRLRPRALPRMDRWRAGYDLVVCCIGNHPAHVGALELLRRHDSHDLPITVIAHDVALPDLYDAAAKDNRLGSDLAAALHQAYRGLPPNVGADGQLDPADVRRYGLVLAREVVAVAARYLVPSDAAARAARIDAHPLDAHRVEVSPLPLTSTSGLPIEARFVDLAAYLLTPAAAMPISLPAGR